MAIFTDIMNEYYEVTLEDAASDASDDDPAGMDDLGNDIRAS